jgi:uncharacterized membrane protein
MSLHELLKFVHVVAAAVWVGGAVMLRVQGSRALAADRARAAQLATEGEQLGMRVLMPASILLLVAGLLTAFEGGYGLEPLWVKLGLAIYVVSAVVGARFLGPLNKQAGELNAERGPDDPELAARLRRISTIGWIDLGLLVAAVFVMVVKPG